MFGAQGPGEGAPETSVSRTGDRLVIRWEEPDGGEIDLSPGSKGVLRLSYGVSDSKSKRRRERDMASWLGLQDCQRDGDSPSSASRPLGCIGCASRPAPPSEQTYFAIGTALWSDLEGR